MPTSVIVATIDHGAEPPSLAATAPDAFLLGVRTAIDHWGGDLEWRTQDALCVRIRGERKTIANRAGRCALSIRTLISARISIALDDDESAALQRANDLNTDVAIRLDDAMRSELADGPFTIENDRLLDARAIGDERTLTEGDVVGRYVVEQVLGQGGMGTVYRARDQKLDRHVALKLLAPGRGSSDAAARLLREARAAASFAHPNVVAVHDVGDTDGVPWVAMELIEGRSLRDAVGDRSITIDERLRWLTDSARALAAGHRAGLVHRDVKPDNVMIRTDGVVKVLDYGIARRLVDDAASELGELATLTSEGTILGTPLYMAPEQMRGDPVDARADQFAWAVTAYELLTGQRPWGVAGDMKALARMLTVAADPIRKHAPELSERVAETIDRALARDADARFPTMDALIASLEGAPERPGRRALLAIPLVLAAIAGGYALTKKKAPLPAPPGVHAQPSFPEAIRAWSDGSTMLARRALEAAVARDESAGSAWLRLSLWIDDLATARAAYQRALRLRDKLDERDRAILEAFEPRHRTPPDAAEWERRLTKIANDPELRIWLARSKRMNGDTNGARALLEDVAKLSPSHAGAALAQLGDIERSLHRSKEALAVFDRCIAASPAAIDCYAGRARVRAVMGDCAGMEADARQWSSLDPHDPAADEVIATALYARRAPIDAVREALRAKAEKLPADQRAQVEQGDAYRVAMAEGDFVLARKNAEERARALPSNAGFFPHFEVAVDRMLAMHESGDVLLSGKHAYEFVKRVRAWTPLSIPQASYPMLMLGRAVDAGAIPRAQYVIERDEMLAVAVATWERAGKPRDIYQRSVIWISAYMHTTFTPADLADAEKALPAYAPLPAPGAQSPEIDGMIGLFHSAAKRFDEAEPYIRVTTDSCNAFGMPHGYVYSHLELGRVLEAKGDKQGAIAAYRVVLDRWAAAKPKSLTVEQARARLQALHAN
jgi:eukaryotic-like serine/threonine-protein kinase